MFINPGLLGGRWWHLRHCMYFFSGDSKMRIEVGEGDKTDSDRYNI